MDLTAGSGGDNGFNVVELDFTKPEQRVVIVGDELVAGVGDPKALGWLGRVLARAKPSGPLLAFPLAVPRETTAELGARWEPEARRRFHDGADNRLVVALGAGDVPLTTSLARARLNLANILDRAEALGLPTFVVGPPPMLDPSADNAKLGDLNAVYQEAAGRRGLPYVDCFRPLENHEQWLSDAAASRAHWPGQVGYGLIAWLVLHHGWQTWLVSE